MWGLQFSLPSQVKLHISNMRDLQHLWWPKLCCSLVKQHPPHPAAVPPHFGTARPRRGIGFWNGPAWIWGVGRPRLGQTLCDIKHKQLMTNPGWLTYPSDKYEFVSWDDEIPNIYNIYIYIIYTYIYMKIIKHVPNHQWDDKSSTLY